MYVVGTVRIWHANTYRLETTLNYGLERVWFICQMRGSNDVAIGYDEGSVMIKVRIIIHVCMLCMYMYMNMYVSFLCMF